ncbi:hypothetical protein SAMN04244547_00047 [Azotobacter vinelandii]|nr:hypothetical protein SAMN04244547_00047 [Azotobacter vinelandii]
MYDCMAIGTNWDQILYWIKHILFCNLSKWHYMMHMNIFLSDFSIHSLKIKTAYRTAIAVASNTLSSCIGASLIGIN